MKKIKDFSEFKKGKRYKWVMKGYKDNVVIEKNIFKGKEIRKFEEIGYYENKEVSKDFPVEEIEKETNNYLKRWRCFELTKKDWEKEKEIMLLLRL